MPTREKQFNQGGYVYMKNIKPKEIESKIVELKGQKVIIDSDVAKLYEVETKEINQAVSNNPDKFPEGYLILLNKEETYNKV